MQIPEGKKVYFASDAHFGIPDTEASIRRERHFVSWLEQVRADAFEIILLGDLFDFWFEYKTVVPKGFVRMLGKLADIRDSGISVRYFVGNHDLWMSGYFERELNIPVYHEPQTFTFNEKTFFVGHGDGLGPGDKGYKRMKRIFTAPLSKLLFRWIHPDIGLRLAQYLSAKNKLISGKENVEFLGENEFLVQYIKELLKSKNYDYFVFGHRHLPLELPMNEGASQYINVGDWITFYTYAVFDGNRLVLKTFDLDISCE